LPACNTPDTVLKIPQPNGRGSLYAAGVRRNRGASGRPKDAIRAKLRRLVDGTSVAFLEGLLSGDASL